MLKHIHMLFVLLTLIGFVARVGLQQFKPESLQHKAVRIGPHIINGLLLLSGIALLMFGNGWPGEFGWVVSKLFLLVLFIAFGIFAMRSSGTKKWAAVAAALLSYFYIVVIAFSKQGFF